MNALFPLILAVAVSMLVIPLMTRAAPSLGLIDRSEPRKVHRSAVPRVGGWGIVLGSLVTLLLVLPLEALSLAYTGGALVLFAFGVWDDAMESGHYTKFLGQFIAAGLVVFGAGLYVERLPFMGLEAIPPAVGIPFTLLALVGAINATNHSDGLDGLAGGETLLSLIAIGFLAFAAGEPLVLAVTAAAAGGILGFLRFNTHPARVFMGDSGSQFLGFTVAFLALYLTQRGNTALSAALPLLLFGLPIVDILAVLFLRIRHGMHWFRASRNHIHHRLLDLGFHHYEAVVIIYSVQSLLVSSALLLRFEADWLLCALYALVCGTLFATLTVLERRGWRAHGRERSSTLARMVDRLATNRAFHDLPMRGVALALPLYLLAGGGLVEGVPRDFGLIAGVLLVMVGAEFALSRHLRPLSQRFVVYVAASFAAYLLSQQPLLWPLLQQPTLAVAFHVLLALAIALTVRYSRRTAFQTTPMDYLLVLGLLAVGLFAGPMLEQAATARILAQAAVVLYGCELLLVGENRGRWLTGVSVVVLAVMTARGLL